MPELNQISPQTIADTQSLTKLERGTLIVLMAIPAINFLLDITNFYKVSDPDSAGWGHIFAIFLLIFTAIVLFIAKRLIPRPSSGAKITTNLILITVGLIDLVMVMTFIGYIYH